MAHERTELELGPGVNALTGPNNTGKSAIVEGLRCVATNPRPRHYIRHGAKEARVTVELDGGTRVVWVRKKRSSGYELWTPGAEEPEEYWKFGRRPPDDILDVLRLNMVELETGREVDVHVGNQRDPVFLLNDPGSDSAAFFAASTESAHLLAMQNLLKRRTQEAKRSERELQGRLSEIEERLDEFSPLPRIADRVETARELQSTAQTIQSAIPVLDDLIRSRQSLVKSLAVADATATILKPLSSAPMLSDVKELRATLHQMTTVESALTATRGRQQTLSALVGVPDTFDTGTLAATIEAIGHTKKMLRKAEDASAISGKMVSPPLIENTEQLSVLISQMLEVVTRSRRLEAWSSVLQTVAEPPVAEPVEPLESLLGSILRMEREKATADASLDDLENRLQTMKQDIAQRVEAIGVCPTCGNDLNSETFLDRGCRHDA